MALNNTFPLNVDLKRYMTDDIPKFRRGDSAILIFKVFDNGVEYNINNATKAELLHTTSRGNFVKSDCTFITYQGKRAIRYQYEDVAMIDLGYNSTMLVIYEGLTVVSIQPFNVLIYSDMKDANINGLLDLIQDLQNQINGLVNELNINAVTQDEKGVPNGVASLDTNGKVPISQLPSLFTDHASKTVYKDEVHGMKINDDGILMYQDNNGVWHELLGCDGNDIEPPTPPVINSYIRVNVGFASSILDNKYREFGFALNNESPVTKVVFTGQSPTLPKKDGGVFTNRTGGSFYNSSSGFIQLNSSPLYDVTSTNTVINGIWSDADDNVIHRTVTKTTSQYNYTIVDDSYVTLHRIKTTSTSYIVPSTIEGKPVYDVGEIFLANTSIDNFTVLHLSIPPTVKWGGRFAGNTETMLSVTIQNPDFDFIEAWSMMYNASTFKIYVPANSAIYDQLSDRPNVETI